MAHYILETLTTNNSSTCDWIGGPGMFAGQGSFGAHTLKLQFSVDGGTTFVDVPGNELILAANDVGAFTIGPCKLKVTVTGGGAAPNVKIRVLPAVIGFVAMSDLKDTA